PQGGANRRQVVAKRPVGDRVEPEVVDLLALETDLQGRPATPLIELRAPGTAGGQRLAVRETRALAVDDFPEHIAGRVRDCSCRLVVDRAVVVGVQRVDQDLRRYGDQTSGRNR